MLYDQRWGVTPGYVEHQINSYCEERARERYLAETALREQLRELATELAIKGWLNGILFDFGLRVTRRPGRLFSAVA